MFIPRIWDNEVERIGKQKCTPFGYLLQGVGELIGFVGLLMLLATPVYLIYRGIVGTFHWSLLLLMLVPLAVGVLDTVIVGISWQIAGRKQFKYDAERIEATWYEGGEKRSFTHAELMAASRKAG
jgi:hypothetical protein